MKDLALRTLGLAGGLVALGGLASLFIAAAPAAPRPRREGHAERRKDGP